MATRWELVVALAREVDEDCAAGRKLDLTRVARLARAVLDFQHDLVGVPLGTRPVATGVGSAPSVGAVSSVGPASSVGAPPSVGPPPSSPED